MPHASAVCKLGLKYVKYVKLVLGPLKHFHFTHTHTHTYGTEATSQHMLIVYMDIAVDAAVCKEGRLRLLVANAGPQRFHTIWPWTVGMTLA